MICISTPGDGRDTHPRKLGRQTRTGRTAAMHLCIRHRPKVSAQFTHKSFDVGTVPGQKIFNTGLFLPQKFSVSVSRLPNKIKKKALRCNYASSSHGRMTFAVGSSSAYCSPMGIRGAFSSRPKIFWKTSLWPMDVSLKKTCFFKSE